MEIQIKARRRIPALESQKIKRKLQKVLRDLAFRNGELSVLFTDDKHMAELNRYYLGRAGPTNVLAFPMSSDPPQEVDSGMLGDIVISVERAMSESRQTGEPLDETLDRLLVHGLLHLLCYDHEGSRDDARRMEEEQGRLLALMRED